MSKDNERLQKKLQAKYPQMRAEEIRQIIREVQSAHDRIPGTGRRRKRR